MPCCSPRLEDLAAEQTARHDGRGPAPDSLREGIRLEGVSSTYPGTEAPLLRDVDVLLRAGATVAIVGDNGAGKTSFVTLLAGRYRPTTGRILVDASTWPSSTSTRGDVAPAGRSRTSSASRPRPATPSASAPGGDGRRRRGGRLADGLDTHLGKTYHDGEELSGGRWQQARGRP